MQIDMHYGAVYYLAMLAGIGAREAEKIAWSSQFVDDATFGGTIQLCDGDGCICSNSAHKNLTDNLSAHARLVWIPYHFVPELSAQGKFLDKLKCARDSSLARAAVDEAIKEGDTAMRPYRFGIALHAYADTWAHYGFSGLASDTNLVEDVKPMNVRQNPIEWLETRFGNVVGRVKADKVNPIGHLFAETCPDIPYLQWQFVVTGKGGRRYTRNNHDDFMKAIDQIYRYMGRYNNTPSPAGLPDAQRDKLGDLMTLKEDNGENRLKEWALAFRQQFNTALPDYGKDAWIDQAVGKKWEKDVCILLDEEKSAQFKRSDYWHFCQGLSRHGNYVVNRLSQVGVHLV